MLDGCSDSVAFRIVSDAPRIASTLVVRAFGHSPSQIDSIGVLLTDRLEQLRMSTLDLRVDLRKRMIRLFRLRFLASPPRVPGGASSAPAERHPLPCSVAADALG